MAHLDSIFDLNPLRSVTDYNDQFIPRELLQKSQDGFRYFGRGWQSPGEGEIRLWHLRKFGLRTRLRQYNT